MFDGLKDKLESFTSDVEDDADMEAAAGEEGWAYELSDELMSPYCPGRALSECPSPQAADLREWIIAQEKAGVSRARVETLLYERFGDQLRQAPRAEGVGLLAYAIPAGLTLVGALVVGLFFAHVRRTRAADPGGGAAGPRPAPAPRELDPELARQVDAELADEEAAAGEDEAEPPRRAASS